MQLHLKLTNLSLKILEQSFRLITANRCLLRVTIAIFTDRANDLFIFVDGALEVINRRSDSRWLNIMVSIVFSHGSVRTRVVIIAIWCRVRIITRLDDRKERLVFDWHIKILHIRELHVLILFQLRLWLLVLPYPREFHIFDNLNLCIHWIMILVNISSVNPDISCLGTASAARRLWVHQLLVVFHWVDLVLIEYLHFFQY